MSRSRVIRRSRRRVEAKTGSFIGRSAPDWDANSSVIGYFTELSKHHALSDQYMDSYISVLPDEHHASLIKELHELCADEIENKNLKEAINEWLESPESERTLDRNILEGIFFWAQKSEQVHRIRGILIRTMKKSGSTILQKENLSHIQSFVSLKKVFSLNDDDLAIIAFCFCVRNNESLSDLVESWGVTDVLYGISICTGISEDRCRDRLSSQEPLLQSGIISSESGIRHSSFFYVLQSSIYSHIAMGGHDILGGKYIDQDSGETYPLETFPVDADLRTTIVDLIRTSNDQTPTNILLYGKEGSGKTEFARAVAKIAGKKLYYYRQQGSNDSGASDDIFNLAFINGSLNGENAVLLIDEAEDLLATKSEGGFFFTPPRTFVKARIHDVLDKAKCPIIWIVNQVKRMDVSTKRRFAFAVEFSALSSASIKNLARASLEDLPVHEVLREQIIELSGGFGLTAASLQYLRETLKSVLTSGMSDQETLKRVTNLFESNVKLLTGKTPVRPEIDSSYSTAALDISVPVERLVSLAQKACDRIDSLGSEVKNVRVGMRFLFHGESGTGKTELARYIAKQIDRPLLVKRASDILDPYVGGSEQNVVGIFREAEATKSLLLLDEADSFFYDRSTASRSWERTLVNEFLVQMEEFKGVLICSTNFASVLDKALARRFHETVEFKPLSRVSIAHLLSRYYPKLSFSDNFVEAIAASGSITPGDFGALKGRTDYLEPEELTTEYIVESLVEMGHAKNSHTAAIGFSS